MDPNTQGRFSSGSPGQSRRGAPWTRINRRQPRPGRLQAAHTLARTSLSPLANISGTPPVSSAPYRSKGNSRATCSFSSETSMLPVELPETAPSWRVTPSSIHRLGYLERPSSSMAMPSTKPTTRSPGTPTFSVGISPALLAKEAPTAESRLAPSFRQRSLFAPSFCWPFFSSRAQDAVRYTPELAQKERTQPKRAPSLPFESSYKGFSLSSPFFFLCLLDDSSPLSKPGFPFLPFAAAAWVGACVVPGPMSFT